MNEIGDVESNQIGPFREKAAVVRGLLRIAAVLLI